jgi:CO dehydrogenase maturation factor
MKIAISGKGGVGKTTLAALLINYYRNQGKKVLAVDADPDANLAMALGVPDPENLVPLSQMKEMIAERTDSKPGSMGGFFKFNPKVDDIPEKYARQIDGIKLIIMGGVKKGGSGCVCPESVLLRTLVTHMVLLRDEPPSSPTPGPVDSRRRRQSGAKEKRAWDEDEKAKRVGSLERDEPIFLPVETLGHR